MIWHIFLYAKVPNGLDKGLIEENFQDAAFSKVGITVEESIVICEKMITQSNEPIWYAE